MLATWLKTQSVNILAAHAPDTANLASAMKKLPSRLLAAALLLALYVGGQALWVNIMHHQFQDDVTEAAAQIGGKIGLKPPSTDDDLRARLLRDAADCGIQLTPQQIQISRHESDGNWSITISVDYAVSIGVPGIRYPLRFSVSATRS
jgi:hypothetical protein